MTDTNPQPSCAAPVLLPTLVDSAFDYLVPTGTPVGTLVETTLAGRTLIGAVWGEGVVRQQSSVACSAQGVVPLPLRERLGEGMLEQGTQSSRPLTQPSPPRGEGFSTPSATTYTLKPITRVIETLPPLKKEYREWLNWIADFTLAPKGAVLSLCGLAHAAKTTRKPFEPAAFDIKLPVLTDAQEQVAEGLWQRATHDASRLKPILLDGVTGSGKTEVYFHAIAKAIAAGEQNAQVLVLLPEISLTHQWLERFEATFGAAPVIWHSRMTPASKARAWQATARGEAQVVVGARSALFLPFEKLGLIIVDEEHDPSYKQEDGVLYHARDMAVARAHFENVPILLVSATPSLETMENVRAGKYRALHLASRYGTAGLPDVKLVDMRERPPERGDFLSPVVKKAALETLARGEQVLFFLNRRGYAPLLLCRACGHRFQCKSCSAWLVVHGGAGSKVSVASGEPLAAGVKGTRSPSRNLSCHHCGHKEKFPDHCPACNADADKLAPCGPGVERIAQEVRGMFVVDTLRENGEAGGVVPLPLGERLGEGAASEAPKSSRPLTQPSPPRGEGSAVAPTPLTPSIITLSSDESIPPETWAAIEAGEIDILVGTQMVAKGHHFPRLTLVVVVDADVGLDGADLRAGERSYQLLHQLGGRAGRGELAGTVLVQTYCPDHPVMKALVAHDRDRLMALEAKERRAGNWPPFGQLAAILLDGKDDASVRAAGQMLARTAPDDARIKVLGPAPAPLSKLRGQYRYRLLVKAADGIHLQRTLRGWLAHQKFKGVRMKVDVNPYYFM
jgi:primosomal protein N' (replication factor Y)